MPEKIVTVFGSSKIGPDHPTYRLGHRWGQILAEMGFAVATGGYDGAMEAVSLGAKEKGGLVIGVTAPPVFPHRSGPNHHVDIELPSDHLLDRIDRLLDLGHAHLALPGGIGTLTEILAAWNVLYIRWLQGRKTKPLGLHASWREIVRPGLMIKPEHVELIRFIESEAELRAFLEGV